MNYLHTIFILIFLNFSSISFSMEEESSASAAGAASIPQKKLPTFDFAEYTAAARNL